MSETSPSRSVPSPLLSTSRLHLSPRDEAAPAPALSVIIPFFNEAANIAPLLAELRATLDSLTLTPPPPPPNPTPRPAPHSPATPAFSAEVLCIDDGSTDTTPAELAAAARTWPALRVIRFPANRGQAAALWHGFQHARGTHLAMLDGDGQNPPSELARLWALRDTADMIAGARLGRQDSALRRAMSRVANTVRRAALRDGVTDTGCSLKLFRREVAASFLPIRTLYSFLPAFAVAAGFTLREVPVAHRPRLAGVSHYGLGVMAVLPLLDLLALCWLLRRTLHRKASAPPPQP